MRNIDSMTKNLLKKCVAVIFLCALTSISIFAEEVHFSIRTGYLLNQSEHPKAYLVKKSGTLTAVYKQGFWYYNYRYDQSGRSSWGISRSPSSDAWIDHVGNAANPVIEVRCVREGDVLYFSTTDSKGGDNEYVNAWGAGGADFIIDVSIEEEGSCACSSASEISNDSVNSGEVFQNTSGAFPSCMSCPSSGGGNFTLGGRYLPAMANINAEMGYAWRNDFDIKLGKVIDLNDEEHYLIQEAGKYHIFTLQPDGSLKTEDDNNRAQIVEVAGQNVFRAKISGLLYEFAVPPDYGVDFLQSITSMTNIVSEIETSGVFEYSGYVVNFTYDATSGNLTQIASETGEYYTFNYNADGLLENVKNHAGEIQRSFVYDAGRNLVSRWQIGLGTTTFTYSAVSGQQHILLSISKPGGVEKNYSVNSVSSVKDIFARSTISIDYKKEETVYTGPQTLEEYISLPGEARYTEYKRPLRDDNGTLIYAVSKEYNSVPYSHPDYGDGLLSETVNENGSTAKRFMFGEDSLEVWSQTTGTDLTVRTTKNEYDLNGNRIKTVTRYTLTIPADTWDTVYEYDSFNRVLKTTGCDGVEHHTSYISPANGWDKRKSAEWSEKNGVAINKTTYEYYAETAPLHQRFRLHTATQHNDTITYTTTYDYIASDPDNPQNVGKVWKKTYEDSSYEEFSYGCCDVTSKRNRNGGTASYLYDAAGRITSVTDASGAITTYTYNAAGKVLTKTLPSGGVITNTYDAQHRRTSVLFADGSSENTTYRIDNQVATQTSRTGLAVTNSYSDTDGAHFAASTVDGTVQALTYDGLGRTLTTTDARSLSLLAVYDDFGRQSKLVYPDASFTEQTFNSAGQLLSSKDRIGNTATFEYDDFGRLSAQVHANGLRRESVFDALSRVTSTTVTDGTTTLTTSYILNFEGRASSVALPDGTSESSTYTDGMLTARTDKAGKTWVYKYTLSGQPDQVIAPDGMGIISDTDYNSKGQVSKLTSANGVAVEYTYDNMGRPTKVIMPDSTFTQTEYGVSGPTAQIDRSGRRTETVFDSYGRKISVTDPKNQTISFAYNLAGDMTSMTDSKGASTQWLYNTEGRMITKTYADSSEYTYQYNSNGKLVGRTDAKGVTTSYSYNNMSQLVGVSYPTDTDISYTYDKFGDRLTMTDASGTTVYSFDAFKRPVGENGPFANNDTLGYTYDTAGRQVSLALNGTVNSAYSYDSMGRISSVNNFAYSYLNASSQVNSMSRDGNEVVANTYDTLGRLTSKTNNNTGGSVVNSYAYTLNNSDERTKVLFADGKYIDYSYDLAGQIIAAKRYFSNDTQDYSYNFDFAYDQMGNPASRTSMGQVKNYTFNNLNQFASATAPTKTDVTGTVTPTITDPTVKVNNIDVTVDANGNWKTNVPLAEGANSINVETIDKFNRTDSEVRNVTLSSPPVFSYDSNGNTTSNGSVNYSWNEENRLVTIEPVTPAADDKKCEFIYDGNGRRRVKKVYTYDGSAWNQTRERHYVYNGFKQIAELDAADALQKSYVWNGEELLSVTDAGTDYFPTIDGNKNITAYIDTSDNVRAKYTYSPFGKVIEKSGDKMDDFELRFSSEVFDSETGLVYYNYRYYSPELGRWLNRDPIGERGGLNLFTMVGNDPVNKWDLLGLIIAITVDDFRDDGEYDLDGYDAKISVNFSEMRGDDSCDCSCDTATNKWICACSYPDYIMWARIDRKNSHRRPGKKLSEKLLRHELGHLKIAMYFAALATRQFRSITGTGNPKDTEPKAKKSAISELIHQIYLAKLDWGRDMTMFQLNYEEGDSGTDHGTNDLQEFWDDVLDDLLDENDEYVH